MYQNSTDPELSKRLEYNSLPIYHWEKMEIPSEVNFLKEFHGNFWLNAKEYYKLSNIYGR